MPTPIPIIAASCVVNSGATITFDNSAQIANPQPMPKSAVRIGRPIASSEPNATSRMMIAARSPMTSGRPTEAPDLEHPSAELEGDAVDALAGVGCSDDVLGGGLVDFARALLELDVGVGDLPVGCDLARAFGRVRARGAADLVDLLDLRQHGLDAALNRGVLHALRGVDDELARVAGARGERLLEQVLRACRLGALDGEALGEVLADGAAQDGEPDEQPDPGQDRQPAMTVREAGEAAKHRCMLAPGTARAGIAEP